MCALAILVIGIDTGHSASCDLPAEDVDRVRDGALYTMISGRWLPMPQNLTARGAVLFTYVVKTAVPRAGVIVIKSGTTRNQSDVAPAQTMVKLVRSQSFSNHCKVSAFSSNEISLKAYSDFHDFGYRGTASLRAFENILHDFHIEYGSKTGSCGSDDLIRRTDSVIFDALLAGDSRSNRSQFSFDPSVVNGGMYSQMLASLGFRSASAYEPNLIDLRVEIIPYRSESNEISCVQFGIPALGPGYSIRINDLEGREPVPPFRRNRERVWNDIFQ
jgi:hypothetical protein